MAARHNIPFSEETVKEITQRLYDAGYYDQVKQLSKLRGTPYRRRPWFPVEDELICSGVLGDVELAVLLGRTSKAVVNRRWRLRNGLLVKGAN